MLKQILLTSTALLFINGCVTKEIIYQQVPQETAIIVPVVEIKAESHTFAGQTLTATPQVSQLVKKIKNLSTNTVHVELGSNQNVQVGGFLNISATPNKDGYLKIIIIDPNGERSLALPNGISKGFLQANQRFYSNNNQFSLKAMNPRGLHYVVMVFSEQNARMIMQQGMNGYNAINSDQDFINILQQIKNQNYGKSHISIFPMRIY